MGLSEADAARSIRLSLSRRTTAEEVEAALELVPRVVAELRALSLRSDAARDVRKFLLHDGFPVDVRHNAKIHREELKVWANDQLGGST